MIRGYVSSDEDDYDDYDFGYSEPLVRENKPPPLPEFQTPEGREIINSVLEDCKNCETFLRAIDRGDLNVAEVFLSKGVSIDCTDSQGWTALMKVCGLGDFEMVQFLLEHGADPNKHRELLTPLMICCTHTLVEEDLKLNCVRLLLENGAEVNARDKFQTTALMYAAGSGYKTIVTKLLEVPGIAVNLQDREGWTALFHAVNNSHVDIVEKLKTVGTDLKLKDRYNRTVITLALDRNLKKTAKVLGYVEEKSTEVSEEREKLRTMFLHNLPDSNGKGGFYLDAKEILFSFNQFNVKDISLPDLLNATEHDLYEVGVKLKPDRLKILSKGIHRYHLKQWKNTSLHQIKPGVPMNLEGALAITGSLAKNLTIANASLRYLLTRLNSRQTKDLDTKLGKLIISHMLCIYNSAKCMQILLSNLRKHIEQIKPEIPPDYIPPYKRERRGFRKYFWYTFAVMSAIIIFNKPIQNFTRVVEFVTEHMSELMGVPEPEPVAMSRFYPVCRVM